MSEGQSLLAILALIYVSECFIWLRSDAIAVVIPIAGRPIVRRPSAWAGNDRGGLAFTTLLPARAVFVCQSGDGVRLSEVDTRVARVHTETRLLRALSLLLFVLLFSFAPIVTWRFGFAQIGLAVIGVLVIANAVMAFMFCRTHRRIDAEDKWHRWTHAVVMLVATPSAVRATDQATRHALREYDPLAVAARLAGVGNPAVKTMLRELAHPARDSSGGALRLETLRKAGIVHVEQPPVRSGDASAYCPRCLMLYKAGTSECSDCEIALLPL